MLIFLGLVGLLGGALFGMGAAHLRNVEARLQAEEALALEESEQKAILAQQAEVEKDILAAGQIYGIEQKALGVKAYETAYAGRAKKGQIGAAAGAGNLAGASILRQALSVQRATERQMTLITGEKQKMAIGYADTLREFDIKKMQLATTLLESETEEEQAKRQLEYLDKYGWMSVVGAGLSGLGGLLSYAK